MFRASTAHTSAFSTSTITRIAGLALATALSATAILPSTSAEAKPKFRISVHIGAPLLGSGYVAGYGVYNPCRWLKRKYNRTGNPAWLDRYYACLDAYY